MKLTKFNLGLTLASVLAVSVLAVGPVSAISGSSGEGSDSTRTTPTTKPVVKTETKTEVKTASTEASGDTSAKIEPELTAEQQARIEKNSEPATSKVSELKLRADKLLAADRDAKKKETKVADRQKACKAREANLNNKIANYGKHAQKQLAAYDATFTKLQTYQTDKNLTASNYAALVATANTNKATATAAVDALVSVSVKIDCTATDPATSVATVREAVKNARVALQAYRASIKDVLVSLMTAKRATNTTTTPSTTSNVAKETTE